MSIGTPFLQRLDALLSRDAVLEHGLLNAASDEIEHLRSELAAARNAALEEAAKVADAQYSAIDDDTEDYVGKERHSDSWKGCSMRIAAAIRELKDK